MFVIDANPVYLNFILLMTVCLITMLFEEVLLFVIVCAFKIHCSSKHLVHLKGCITLLWHFPGATISFL